MHAQVQPRISFNPLPRRRREDPLLGRSDAASMTEDRYEARLAQNTGEILSALALRHKVFNIELGGADTSGDTRLEFDEYDLKCRHLIVIDRESNDTVGTYRLNTYETARSVSGFYSAREFTIENLPADVLKNGVEIGRACIAREHRNTKVLFLLWKALLAHSAQYEKRYFFGCCSIFSRDIKTGQRAYEQLRRGGLLDGSLRVHPKKNAVPVIGSGAVEDVELPPLFNMYLRLGARVCGPPMIDHEFGTIDFFVVFDVRSMNEKYRRMFAPRVG